MHRDIKPEKFVFGKDGYLHITGFRVAFKCKKAETVISASGIYEVMIGERPYQGRERRKIKEAMFNNEINLDKNDILSGWVTNVMDLINGLLKRNKKFRLGSNGFDEVKNHPRFKDIQWDKIENCEFVSHITINDGDYFDEEYTAEKEDDSISEGNKQYFNYGDKIKNDENKYDGNKKDK